QRPARPGIQLRRPPPAAILPPTNIRRPMSSSDDRTRDRASAAQSRARAHWRVAVAILGVNSALYLTLIVSIAYAKPFLGRLVAPGLSLAILSGPIVTVSPS